MTTQDPTIAELEARIRALEERLARYAFLGLRVLDTSPLFASGGTNGTSTQAARRDHTH